MQKYSELQTKLIYFTVLPVIMSCLILFFIFTLLNSAKNQQSHQNTVNLLRSVFTLDKANYSAPLKEIGSRAQSLQIYDNFHKIIILDQQKNLVNSFGSPQQQISYSLPEGNYHCTSNYCHYRIKTNLLNHEYEIVASRYDNNWLIDIYRVFVCLLVTGLICSFFIIFCTYQFKKYLIHSIDKISTSLKDLKRQKFETTIPHEPGGVYNMLIEEINSLTKELKEVKQNDVEASLRELNETLETVEIQNIELDLARKNALGDSRVKSEFLAKICHEIRTPLNGIIGFSGLLHRTELSLHQQEYLETIEESAKGLLVIVNDILDFSRLEIGKLSLEYKPIRIRQVVEDAVKLHAPSAQEKRLQLLTIIDHDFTENLFGDPLRLKQVLSNLISNAIKYTESGHILISVSKDSESHSQITLKFSVTDSGIGLSEEQKESLFEAFSRPSISETQTTEGGTGLGLEGSTGLGLAIAKGLVDSMNGCIGVESELENGATFWFTVTLGYKAKLLKGHLTKTLSQVNAIVCESDPLSRNEITHYLRGWGANVLEEPDCNKVFSILINSINKDIHLAVLSLDNCNAGVDEHKLQHLLNKIKQQASIKVLLISPVNSKKQLESLFASDNILVTTRPIYCNQFHHLISQQLGITNKKVANTENSGPAKASKNAARVLAVDDNRANLRLVLELLSELGTETVGLDNGVDALAELKKSRFDLILMDLQMPDMDGLEVTRRIRALESPTQRTPIVALTAHTVSEQKSTLLLAGMDDYLTKPVNENELRHVLERWTNRQALATHAPISAPDINDNPSPSDTHSTPLVDLKLSLALAKNKADLAKEMLEMLLVDLTKARNELIQLAESKDYPNLQEIVHKIHGGSCYCGIPKLKELAETYDKKLENIVNNSSSDSGVDEDMQKLVALIDELVKWKNLTNLDHFFDISD